MRQLTAFTKCSVNRVNSYQMFMLLVDIGLGIMLFTDEKGTVVIKRDVHA